METKRCSSCGNFKTHDKFYKDNRRDGKRSKDGLYSCCKQCQNEKTRKWRRTYPEKMYSAKKNWVQKNRERVRMVALKRDRVRRKIDPLGFAEYKRKYATRWRLANPDKVAWKSIKSSAHSRGLCNEISFDEFKREYWGKKCVYCNGTMTGLDRIDSTNGYKKNNVVPSCGKCNIMKFDLPLGEFFERMNIILKNRKRICQTIKDVQNQ